MSNRHLSRSLALQTLFEFDIRDGFVVSSDLIDDRVALNKDEFAPGLTDIEFAKNIIQGVVAKRDTLDEILTKAAPDWPLEKIPNVDRNILRIGLFELLFADHAQVPPKVAIDEAIELGKQFGGEATARFVNGVLGRVYKEMGEPGKNDQSPLGLRKKKPVDMSALPEQKMVGSVVYSRDEAGQIYIALVHDIFGHWTLSKGKADNTEETLEQTAIRKAHEELGIHITIKTSLGENEYVSSHPELKKVRKHVYYFLGEAKYEKIHFEMTGGLDDAAWFKVEDLHKLEMYEDIIPIIQKGISLI